MLCQKTQNSRRVVHNLFVTGQAVRPVVEKPSLSKYVVKKLDESITNSWPGNYDSLFGSMDDASFVEPESQSFAQDRPSPSL